MFNYWRQKRETDRAISATEKALAALRDKTDDESLSKNFKLQGRLASQLQRKEIMESRMLRRKARKMGIEIPRRNRKPDWYSDDNEDGGLPPEEVTVWLNGTGRSGVRRLIKLERRGNVEWWWSKIILPALQALVPIIALIVSLVSVSKT
jgi:hypothetical protein